MTYAELSEKCYKIAREIRVHLQAIYDGKEKMPEEQLTYEEVAWIKIVLYERIGFEIENLKNDKTQRD